MKWLSFHCRSHRGSTFKSRRLRGLALPGMVALAAALLAIASPALAVKKPSLVVAVGAEPVTFDPHRLFGGNDRLFFCNTFEGLYGHDEKGKLVPALATLTKMSPDGITYDFTVRQNAKFHNGEPVTAEDIRFSWQRGVAPETKNSQAGVLLANIKDVEVVNTHKIRVKLKKRDASFLENSADYWYIIPKKYMTAVGTDEFARKPIGTGPFMFVERRPKSYIKLRGFEQHWGRVPKVGEVTMKIVPDDQSRVAQIQTGEADLVTNVPPFMAESIKKLPKAGILRVPSYMNVYLAINASSNNTALSKKEVRQALNMAINKEALRATSMFSFATPEELACVPGIDGCKGKVVPYSFNPRKAHELLQKAGYDFNRPLKFISLAPGRVPQSKETVEGIASFLQQAGVKTEITTLEYGAWLALLGAKAKDKSVDLIFTTFTDYTNDPSGRLMRSVRSNGPYTWASDAKIDSMLERMNDFASLKKRNDFLSTIFKEVHDSALMIPLWSVDSIYAVSKNVKWAATPNVSYPVLWNLEKK